MSRLDQAVKAALSVERMNRPAQQIPEPPSAPADRHAAAVPAPPPPPRRALWRRALRKAMRIVRPLVAPLLFRVQVRVSSGIDNSQTRQIIDRIALGVEAIESRIGALEQGLSGLDLRVMQLQDLINERAIGIREATRGARLQAEVVGGRLQREIAKISAAIDQHDAALAQKILHIGEQVDGISTVLDQQDASLAQQAVAIDAVENYSALILQRNAIPLPGAIAIRTDTGYVLTPPEDEAMVLSMMEARGRMEPGTLDVMLTLLGEGMSMIDVGANVGGLALPAAVAVGPTGSVLALEPAPRIADLLRRTALLNGASWLRVETVAASDTDGVVRLHLSLQTSHNSILPVDDEIETIVAPALRLDSLIPPGGRVDVIKVDVEGVELQVWRGAQRIVADNPDIALILEFGPSHLRNAGISISDWFGELQSSGMTAWEIDEASGAVRALRASGLDEVFSMNILLMRASPATRGLVIA